MTLRKSNKKHPGYKVNYRKKFDKRMVLRKIKVIKNTLVHWLIPQK